MFNLVIKDNVFSKDFIDYLYGYCLSLPHYYDHYSSSPKEITFYNSNINLKEPLINFIFSKIKKFQNYNLTLLRAYINVQFNAMDGSFHKDDGDITGLIMVSKTLSKNSGNFVIKINNKEKKEINFIQNRVILFPALWEHKGDSPKETNCPRITMAFKMKVV
jgi:hypothetical protein